MFHTIGAKGNLGIDHVTTCYDFLVVAVRFLFFLDEWGRCLGCNNGIPSALELW